MQRPSYICQEIAFLVTSLSEAPSSVLDSARLVGFTGGPTAPRFTSIHLLDRPLVAYRGVEHVRDLYARDGHQQ